MRILDTLLAAVTGLLLLILVIATPRTERAYLL